MTTHAPPSTLANELRRLTVLELSGPARMRYVVVLLSASVMTVVVGALLITEPGLPERTSIALGVMAVIGLSWTGFSGWVLTYRRILLGRERVVAGRLSVVFSGAFVVGAAVLAYSTHQPAALAAGGLGLLMCGVALTIWVRARAAFKKLSARREALEHELGIRS
jgi:hypothetical protein